MAGNDALTRGTELITPTAEATAWREGRKQKRRTYRGAAQRAKSFSFLKQPACLSPLEEGALYSHTHPSPAPPPALSFFEEKEDRKEKKKRKEKGTLCKSGFSNWIERRVVPKDAEMLRQ